MSKFYYEIQIPENTDSGKYEKFSDWGDGWHGIRILNLDTRESSIKKFNKIKKEFNIIRLVQFTTTPEHAKKIIAIKEQ